MQLPAPLRGAGAPQRQQHHPISSSSSSSGTALPSSLLLQQQRAPARLGSGAAAATRGIAARAAPSTTTTARAAQAASGSSSGSSRASSLTASSRRVVPARAAPAAAAAASAPAALLLAQEQAALVEHHVATARFDSGPTEVSVSRLLASGNSAAAAEPQGYVVRVSVPSRGAFGGDGDPKGGASPADGQEVLLHWGVDDWAAPGAKLASSASPGTRDVGDAAQTPFVVDAGDPERATVELRFAADEAPSRVVFVVKLSGPGGERWVNNGGPGFPAQLKTPSVANLASKAVSAEATAGHWTLLDRFRLAAELLSATGSAASAALALPAGTEARHATQRSADELAAFVFTWLRLSSQRVLPWGRKGAGGYQPKDMSWTQRSLAEAAAALARHGGGDGSGGDGTAASAQSGRYRMFARWLAADLPRGGGNGDDVRLGILNVMRDGGIKEGHRPGHDEPFLEQWHQKLHQNTDPSDVAIGEAYCAYLRSGGNEGEWWRVLWEVGKLDAKTLADMPRPITHVPHNLPHLLGPAQHYLWILKTVHSGAEMDTAAEMCKGHLGEHDRWLLFDLLSNREAWWAGGRAVELREAIAGVWRAKGDGAPRDLLLLDAALDGFARRHLGRADLRALSVRDRVGMAALGLRNAALSCEDAEVAMAARQWARLEAECPPGDGDDAIFGSAAAGGDWPLAALAATRRASLALAAFADDVRLLVQPAADRFGSAGGFLEDVDPAYIESFAEEAIRGSAAFSPASVLASLEPDLRRAAGAPAWTLVSQPPPSGVGGGARGVVGVVRRVADLKEVQGGAFGAAAGEALPCVLVADTVGGSEDIPLGVAAVITRGATDVLSHVAIRARAQRVLFACCGDNAEWAAVLEACGGGGSSSSKKTTTAVDLVVTADGQVVAEPADYAALTSGSARGGQQQQHELPPPLQLPAPKKTDAWVVGESAFGGLGGGLVGGKAARLAELRAKLPGWLNVPRGVALPFGTFERVLAHAVNADAKAAIAPLRARLDAAAAAADAKAGGQGAATLPAADLAALRGAVSGEDLSCPPLLPPAELAAALAAEAGAAGIILDSEKNEWEAWAAAAAGGGASSSSSAPPPPDSLLLAWRSVLGVWASKWTDRAWLSRRARRVPEPDLSMSVLLQRVEPARYAFVAHTADPVTGARDGNVHGEAVVGMGEVLVSAAPGSALRFEAALPADPLADPSAGGGGGGVSVLSLPSKRVAAWAAGGGGGGTGAAEVGAAALIARSDANGEDLESFAGAGLYDSIPATPLRYEPCDYSGEAVFWEKGARERLARRVASAAAAVEAAMGGGAPQDVEGLVDAQGRVTVVQTRPQVVESAHSTAR